MRVLGENVSSFEVEQDFGTHPAGAEVDVVRVCSELGEQDIIAQNLHAADSQRTIAQR